MVTIYFSILENHMGWEANLRIIITFHQWKLILLYINTNYINYPPSLSIIIKALSMKSTEHTQREITPNKEIFVIFHQFSLPWIFPLIYKGLSTKIWDISGINIEDSATRCLLFLDMYRNLLLMFLIKLFNQRLEYSLLIINLTGDKGKISDCILIYFWQICGIDLTSAYKKANGFNLFAAVRVSWWNLSDRITKRFIKSTEKHSDGAAI